MTSNRTAMLSAAAEIRFAMLRNGYLPLSCHGKRPDGEEWQKRTSTNEQEIALWDWLWPYSGNTGCLTRNTPTLDVDITDRAACNAVLRPHQGAVRGFRHRAVPRRQCAQVRGSVSDCRAVQEDPAGDNLAGR